MLRFILNNAFFALGKKYYKQIKGGAMGSAVTQVLADVYMMEWESDILAMQLDEKEIYDEIDNSLRAMERRFEELMQSLQQQFEMAVQPLKQQIQNAQGPVKRLGEEHQDRVNVLHKEKKRELKQLFN
ncbi:unnamed protein product, partial [Didymodactylos carnosus]